MDNLLALAKEEEVWAALVLMPLAEDIAIARYPLSKFDNIAHDDAVHAASVPGRLPAHRSAARDRPLEQMH
jgi:hypothetical protein